MTLNIDWTPHLRTTVNVQLRLTDRQTCRPVESVVERTESGERDPVDPGVPGGGGAGLLPCDLSIIG